jgi:hypothetical protein
MRAKINELLTLCRLPHALWTSIHGGREFFDNPGSSVMSFCSRYLGSEYMEIPDDNDIAENVTACRDFSTKREHIAVIVTHLEVKAATFAAQCNELTDQQKKVVFRELNDVVKYNQEVKKLQQSFEVNQVMPNRLDASSQMYAVFSQALMDLHYSINNLADLLVQLANPAPPQPPKTKA